MQIEPPFYLLYNPRYYYSKMIIFCGRTRKRPRMKGVAMPALLPHIYQVVLGGR